MNRELIEKIILDASGGFSQSEESAVLKAGFEWGLKITNNKKQQIEILANDDETLFSDSDQEGFLRSNKTRNDKAKNIEIISNFLINGVVVRESRTLFGKRSFKTIVDQASKVLVRWR